MADNDEYQFTELDPTAPEEGESSEETSSEADPIPLISKSVEGNNIKRNAIIAIVAFVLLMFIYKFVGSFFSRKPVVPKQTQPAAFMPQPVTVPKAPTVAAQTTTASTSAAAPAPVNVGVMQSPELASKLSRLEIGQENINADISSMNHQIGGMNSSFEAVTTKIAELNRMVTDLSTKLDTQMEALEQLKARTAPNVVRHKRAVKHYLHYYVQAVIPGRAWLVGTNGSTLTVREGSTIEGYGQVTLIDPNQGRVLTSSGQVIRFSQEDS